MFDLKAFFTIIICSVKEISPARIFLCTTSGEKNRDYFAMEHRSACHVTKVNGRIFSARAALLRIHVMTKQFTVVYGTLIG
jgi:hypothetical protein